MSIRCKGRHNRASARSFSKSASAAFLRVPTARELTLFSAQQSLRAHKPRGRPGWETQTYLAQVQFAAEIRVGRIMFVQSATSVGERATATRMVATVLCG